MIGNVKVENRLIEKKNIYICFNTSKRFAKLFKTWLAKCRRTEYRKRNRDIRTLREYRRHSARL